MEIALSTFRRNENDVVNLYNTFSNLMQILTEGYMLNFGFWDNSIINPLEAQYALSSCIGEFASLNNANKIADVGSGYSAPAVHWLSQYNNLEIYCININFHQLKIAVNYSNFQLKNQKFYKRQGGIKTHHYKRFKQKQNSTLEFNFYHASNKK